MSEYNIVGRTRKKITRTELKQTERYYRKLDVKQ